MPKKYTINRVVTTPDLADWNSPSWMKAESLEVSEFRPEGSNHRPLTRVKLLYDKYGLHGIFKVEDRYVRCIRQGLNESVCKDSCVEFFCQPLGCGGYLNFEINCGGAILCYFIEDSTRTPQGFAKFVPLPESDLRQVRIRHSLPILVEPEITEPVEWTLGFSIPFILFETYRGKIDYDLLPETPWRANFYKCGDDTSHPHWASWCPVSAKNFHLPECFGEITFSS